MGFMPWVGPTLVAADDLAATAEQATTLAANGLKMVTPALAATPWDPVALTAVGKRVPGLADDLARSYVSVSDLAAVRPFPRPLAKQVQGGQAAVRLAQAAVDLGPPGGVCWASTNPRPI